LIIKVAIEGTSSIEDTGFCIGSEVILTIDSKVVRHSRILLIIC
jgi:hypothetical protein